MECGPRATPKGSPSDQAQYLLPLFICHAPTPVPAVGRVGRPIADTNLKKQVVHVCRTSATGQSILQFPAGLTKTLLMPC